MIKLIDIINIDLDKYFNVSDVYIGKSIRCVLKKKVRVKWERS